MSTLAARLDSQRRLLFIAGLGWLFDAMDVGLLSFVITALVDKWGLTAQQAGWLGSINSIGMTVGAFLAGIFADRIGRKPIFISTLLLFSIASGLSALATGFMMMAVLRFFIGAGLGGELPVASTLVSESVAAKDRGRVVVLLESFWAGGWILAALVGFYLIPTLGWQAALLAGAIPALYAVFLRLNLPDSPRLQATPAMRKRSVWQNMKSVWSKEYIRPTFMLWVLWFTVVFSYYGMFLWLPTVMTFKGFALIKSFQYVLIMTLAQLPGYFSAAYFIERFGRKFVLITYLTLTAVSAYFFGNATSAAMLLTSGIFLSFFNLGAWGALYAYTPEQYPTAFRSTGAGMAAAFGRIGGILGPLLVGYLGKAQIGLTFNIFFVVIMAGVAAVALLGRETRAEELVD